MTVQTSIIIGVSISIIMVVVASILHKRSEKKRNKAWEKEKTKVKKGPNFFVEMAKITEGLNKAVDNMEGAKEDLGTTMENVGQIGDSLKSIEHSTIVIQAKQSINNN